MAMEIQGGRVGVLFSPSKVNGSKFKEALVHTWSLRNGRKQLDKDTRVAI